jgi:hypothetical protein
LRAMRVTAMDGMALKPGIAVAHHDQQGLQ